MKQPQDKTPAHNPAKGTRAAAGARQPARMPKPPKRPTSVESDAAMRALTDDDQERRDAAKAYLESERASARLGMDVPDLPRTPPNPRD